MYNSQKNYEENFKELKGIRQIKDKKAIIDKIVKMSKQVNQRLYRLEKKGLQKESYGYERAVIETGKEKPRYSTAKSVYENLPFNTLYEIALQINVKIYSNTTTVKGLIEVRNKKMTNSIQAIKDKIGIELNRNEFEEFLKMGGGELLNNKYLSSTQIIEDFNEITKDGNVSIKEFLREFKRFKNIKEKRVDYGRIRRNLKNLKARKKK